MMCCVEAGMGVGPVGFSVEQQNLLWAMWRRGDSIREMEAHVGRDAASDPAGSCVSRVESLRFYGSAGPLI